MNKVLSAVGAFLYDFQVFQSSKTIFTKNNTFMRVLILFAVIP